VDDKSNESTARPALLARLNLHGSVGTRDAMGGQGERARQVVDPGGAAVLSLQENQPGLPRACAALFEGLRGPHPIDEGVVLGCDAQVEGGTDAERPARAGGRRHLPAWKRGSVGRV
jgi:predicted transposase YbfD/YdcC